MTVLVTGANGSVGSCVVARLDGAGEKVVAVGRGRRRELPSRVEYVELDLARPDGLRELIASTAPRGVIHCAAMTDVDACERDSA